jgi:hypothetical protein
MCARADSGAHHGCTWGQSGLERHIVACLDTRVDIPGYDGQVQLFLE